MASSDLQFLQLHQHAKLYRLKNNRQMIKNVHFLL